MMRSTVIRRASFSAEHHYARPEWSVEKNRQVFGASSEPHGHNYEVEVVVRGEIDPLTGFLVDLVELDRVLKEEVVARLDQRSLNDAIPEVREGRMVPTTESLARWFWRVLEGRIPGLASLDRVRVFESGTLAAEYWEETE
jgi:6-pyruvoyltetrahydropterin/6-carboxytetrahydropterin synthase